MGVLIVACSHILRESLSDEMKGFYKFKPQKHFVHPYRGITHRLVRTLELRVWNACAS